MTQVYKTRDLPFTHLIMISVVCYITHCPKLQRLPDSFMNMLGEDPPNNVKLRQAGSGFRRQWDVELVIKEGHMYLYRGWEKFYRAYDLRLGVLPSLQVRRRRHHAHREGVQRDYVSHVLH